MKKILVLFIAVLLLGSVHAQKGKKDIVYLKSGGIIKGQLITHDAEKVKINSSGNEWVFNVSEVDSVSKYSKNKQLQESNLKYFFDTSMGVLIGNSGNEQKAPFSFATSVNYRIIPNLYAGVGLGAEFLDETYMPVFAQIQYKFRHAKFTPFVNLQAGYQVPLEDGNHQKYIDYVVVPNGFNPELGNSHYGPFNQRLNSEGGFLINPSIGFQRFTSDNLAWFFSFGYRYHQLNYSGENSYKLETNFSRLSLKIGFIFN